MGETVGPLALEAVDAMGQRLREAASWAQGEKGRGARYAAQAAAEGLALAAAYRTLELDARQVLAASRQLRERHRTLRAALTELVALETLKDTAGKTDEDERRQPLAWEAARRALGLTEGDDGAAE